jgi:hypothetical protein
MQTGFNRLRNLPNVFVKADLAIHDPKQQQAGLAGQLKCMSLQTQHFEIYFDAKRALYKTRD